MFCKPIFRQKKKAHPREQWKVFSLDISFVKCYNKKVKIAIY